MSDEGLLSCLKHAYDISCETIREYDKHAYMFTAIHDDNSAAYYQHLSDAEWRKADYIAKIISEIKGEDH